ncbi:conserved hypothetical protein [Tenacibaculum litoreum]|uniref:helix-turn-helix domain-containing protein n=1 Tax=Tenacibaculum litoreum TaxID=321269 RepID=UPI0038945E5B
MISEKKHRPNAPLNQFVDFIWIGQAPELNIESNHYAPLFTELIFNYGDIFQVEGQNIESFKSKFVHQIISGLKTEPFKTKVSGTYNCVGFILKPFCYSYLIDKLGTQDFEHLSEIIYESLFDCKTPNFIKLESHLVNLFSKHQMNSNLIKYEEYISKKNIHNGVIKDFNLSIDISQKTFTQKFKEHYKITPNQYFKLKKINKAIQLIQNNKTYNLTQVGLSSGFYDQSHFIKTFKKFCGYSPKKYLKSNQR